jgi:hypothetical protein
MIQTTIQQAFSRRYYSLLSRVKQRSLKLGATKSHLDQFFGPSVTASTSSCSYHRWSSTSSKQQQIRKPKLDNKILIYQRESERNKVPRAAFGFSVANTTYWLWYALDFIPAVNTSPITDLHIDPAIGFGGVALGFFINALTGLYPTSLISKLAYDSSTGTFFLWKHDMPFIRQSAVPLVYPLGSLKMDHSSSDTRKLVKENRNYKGHLGISVEGRWIPMLLEVRGPSELLDPQLMLQALLDPKAAQREMKTTSREQKQQTHTKKRP